MIRAPLQALPQGMAVALDEPATGPWRGAVVASLMLHALAVLAFVYALPRWPQPALPAARTVAIDLVAIGDRTETPPAATGRANLPQQQAKEEAIVQHTAAVPVEQAPPPNADKDKPGERTAPSPYVASTPERPAKTQAPRAARPSAPTVSKPQPAPVDELSQRLALLSQLQQPQTPVPPAPRTQDGTGQSNLAARSPDSEPGQDAVYAVRDFIRAQVERRWNPDLRAARASWVVAIRIVMRPDGTVTRAEVVDQSGYRDRAYQDFALSARNAVLLSSPLTIPVGRYDLARDIVVEFDPKRLLP